MIRKEIFDYDAKWQADRRRTLNDRDKLGEHGGDRTEQGDNTTLPVRGSTGAAYLIARLKRDAPEIAERLAAGEFKSARAAAIAAGIIEETPPLVWLQRWWKRASENERAA